MESPLSFFRMNWDHEPERANVGQASRLPNERISASKNAVGFADGGRRDARPTLRFMVSRLSVGVLLFGPLQRCKVYFPAHCG